MSQTVINSLDAEYIGKLDPAKHGAEYSVFLSPSRVVRAAEIMLKNGYFLEDVSGVDVAEGLMAVYHYDSMDKPGRIVLRAMLPHDKPEIPSISNVFQGAEWHERETADFYGIVFTDITNDAPLLLPAEERIEPPLVKTAKTRKPVAEIIPTGEEISKASGFTLFDAQEEEKTEG